MHSCTCVYYVCLCMCVFVCLCVSSFMDMAYRGGEKISITQRVRGLCRNMTWRVTLAAMYTLFRFGFWEGRMWHPLSVLLKMPFESTLLHFTCLLCRNSVYSRNKTIQSTNCTFYQMERVLTCASPNGPNCSHTEGSKIALGQEWANLQYNVFPEYRGGQRNIIKQEPSLCGDRSVKYVGRVGQTTTYSPEELLRGNKNLDPTQCVQAKIWG